MIVIIPILPKKKRELKEITYLAPSHIKSQASKPQSQDVNPKSTYLMTTLYHLPSSQSLFIAVSGSTWTHKLWIRERGLSSCPEVSPLSHSGNICSSWSDFMELELFLDPKENWKFISSTPYPPAPDQTEATKRTLKEAQLSWFLCRHFLPFFLSPNHSFKKHITFVPYSWHRVEAIILPSYRHLKCSGSR